MTILETLARALIPFAICFAVAYTYGRMAAKKKPKAKIGEGRVLTIKWLLEQINPNK